MCVTFPGTVQTWGWQLFLKIVKNTVKVHAVSHRSYLGSYGVKQVGRCGLSCITLYTTEKTANAWGTYPALHDGCNSNSSVIKQIHDLWIHEQGVCVVLF
jgi:hypothetical protein